MNDVLFLPVSGPKGASSRYRVFQFLPSLAEIGVKYALHLPVETPGKGLKRLVSALQERRLIERLAKDSRAVFIQKRLLPVSLIDRLSSRLPLLFDFDDAIFTSPTQDRSQIAQKRVEQRLHYVLTAARLVLAGNRYLYDYASQFAKRVILLPTVIDSARYPAKVHSPSNEIVIGWIGHSVNLPYLREISDILEEVAKTFPLRLLVVSDRDIRLPGIQVDNRRWSKETEIADILEMDIGVMPMPDDPWSRGKCGFKAIQYMAAGIPVVCSAVGANVDIVRDEVDGFCVKRPEDWRARLLELCSSVELRRQMGSRARMRVQEAYSLAALQSRWQAAIIELLGNGRASAG